MPTYMRRTLITFLFALLSNFATSLTEKPNTTNKHATATFAGGCFWCVESDFEKVPGVVTAVSGYSGGDKASPSYKFVASGRSKHIEAVKITFDPNQVSYDELLVHFWQMIDPTDKDGSFVDRGRQYTSAIFYHNEQQRLAAEASKKILEDSNKFSAPIATRIVKFKNFYDAEDYHQDYYKENPIRYNYYRYRSGRDQFIEKHWKNDKTFEALLEQASIRKSTRATDILALDTLEYFEDYEKPGKHELKSQLSRMQYHVTQKDGTEPPFKNEYWNNKQAGIYVDVVSGEPLFSSTHKFDSGTGWPSFYRPIEKDFIVTKKDYSFFVKRIELRSKFADSHLGHVFDDGPRPTGLRYCINSAALRFVPAEKLEEEGYGKYLYLFSNA